MNAVELYLLARKLGRIAEEALPGADAGTPRTSVRMVAMDVAEHPDTSIGEIAARTGFPQSHVSASVALLRERGALATSADTRDGRRTLVRMTDRARRMAQDAALPIDEALARAMGTAAEEDLPAARAALDALAELLLPAAIRGPRDARRGTEAARRPASGSAPALAGERGGGT